MKHVIVGNGVAGVTAAQSIVRADPLAEVHIFGAEPYPYYRRPLLWEFIAGQIEQDALYFRPAEWYAERSISLHTGVRVAALTPSAHRLTLADGEAVVYDRLLLATGGRPFIPPCEGTNKKGVFTLRTLDDALAIKAYAQKVSTAAIVGGGLLGLETARALRTAGLDVTVVEFAPHLLPRQLDAEGAAVLQSLLEAQGLQIITGGTIESVQGNEHAHCIWLQDDRTVSGELVIFSTGIRSETTLAQAAGLEVNRGIVVNEQLQTRRVDGHPADDVFAAGDVAEFKGLVYGIIPPAIEQARVAAANMVSLGSSTYTGTLPATTLKVAGAELTSVGQSVTDTDGYVELRRVDLPAGRYRKLVLRDGRIVGAILLNDTELVRPISQLIEQEVDVSAPADRLLDNNFDLKSLLKVGTDLVGRV
jgi:nitrite reductase (NADH) large subunit